MKLAPKVLNAFGSFRIDPPLATISAAFSVAVIDLNALPTVPSLIPRRSNASPKESITAPGIPAIPAARASSSDKPISAFARL